MFKSTAAFKKSLNLPSKRQVFPDWSQEMSSNGKAIKSQILECRILDHDSEMSLEQPEEQRLIRLKG